MYTLEHQQIQWNGQFYKLNQGIPTGAKHCVPLFTCSREKIVILDIGVYIDANQLHTQENRKETASNLYLRRGSAHPDYTFKGIVKSQLKRLRRLCSKNDDFLTSIELLRTRCYNSGYERKMVDDILKDAHLIKRDFRPSPPSVETITRIRWVILAGSKFEKEQMNFIRNMNSVLREQYVAFEVIKITGPTLGSLLFNNYDKSSITESGCNGRCLVCKNNARGDPTCVISSVTKKKYFINPNTNCQHSGIYGITCKCAGQYAGKTTITNGGRFREHWFKATSVRAHLRSCVSKPTVNEVKVQFLEIMWDRGKYSLSEREYLWNKGLKGNINIRKTASR